MDDTPGKRMQPEVKTLARGLRALDILLSEGSLRTTDLAARLDIDKGSASRLLHTLAAANYATPAGRHYEIGPRLQGRHTPPRPSRTLRERARPLLERAFEETKEAVHLSVLADEHVVYLDTINTTSPLRVDRPAGTLAPAVCTAMGRVLLATTRAAIPMPLIASTPNTVIETEAFHALLAQIRADGFALDDEEYHIGIRCVAAPLSDSNGAVIGAIGVSGPSARISREDLPRMAAYLRDLARSANLR